MREIKGLDGSNLPFSASQSVHFTYILEKAETPRGTWRSFCRSASERAGSRRIHLDGMALLFP
jgi:hypothetical protein